MRRIRAQALHRQPDGAKIDTQRYKQQQESA
jgi:hypothetical protein